MARVVYTGIDCQHELKGSLFEGQKFWFSQKVPQRKWFMEQVEVSATGLLTTELSQWHSDLCYPQRAMEVL